MKRRASKSPARRKVARGKKNPYIKFVIIGLIVVFIGSFSYYYRDGLAYYLGFKSDKALRDAAADKRLADLRNIQILVKHDGMAVGFDVSEYQGKINWAEVDSIDAYQFEFVFIRATAGKDKVDAKFQKNWLAAKNSNLLCGAYHYYRPNENSIEQANNFIKTVKLRPGDLPPVLDIEQLPETQSIDSLKMGLRRWLNRVENHYKVKPIIYSGERYYADFLKEEFAGYKFWIANYNFFVGSIDKDWLFWQFTEKGTVNGIKGNVDLNVFNGNAEALDALTIKR